MIFSSSNSIYIQLTQLHLLRNLNVLAGIKLFKSSQVHRLLQQGNDVRIESLPVRVLKMILLALQNNQHMSPCSIDKLLTLSCS